MREVAERLAQREQLVAEVADTLADASVKFARGDHDIVVAEVDAAADDVVPRGRAGLVLLASDGHDESVSDPEQVVRLDASARSEAVVEAVVALTTLADQLEVGADSLRVLIVEDEPLMIDVVSSVLDESGVPVSEKVPVMSMADAQSQIAQGQPDVIIADLNLPDSSGLDTVRALRSAAPEAALVVLTGMADESLALQSVLLGADDYLIKSRLDHRELWRSLRYATQRKRFEHRVAYLSQFDRLTGLLNRYSFAGRLADALNRAQLTGHQVGVLLVDLDRFKAVRKWLGQTAADALIREVANRIRTVVPEHAAVAREGEDEFAILLENIGPTYERLRAHARKILASLRTPFPVDGGALTCTASLGAAMHPAAGSSVEALMRAADSAVMVAKARGRNTLHIAAGGDPGAPLSRLRLENALRRALEQRTFAVHLQPIYDLQDGRMVSCEALLRWQPEDGSKVATQRVVRALEDMGLIAQAGRMVLRSALAQIAALRKRPGAEHVRVAVNLSPLQFSQDELVQEISDALAEAELPPEALELEITETILLDQTPEVKGALMELKSMGVQVAIDDFGTGYSSFAYLSRFRCDVLKIDRQFVAGIGTADGDASVRAIIGLSRELGVGIVAEGVENREQLDFLVAEGCQRAQGFLLARPTPEITDEQLRLSMIADLARRNAPGPSQPNGQMAHVLDALPEVVVEFDRHGRFVGTYGRSTWFGVPLDGLLGKSLHETVPEAHARTGMAAIRRALDTGLMQVTKFDIQRDGRANHFEARLSPTQAGTVLMVARAITERVKAREQLAERAGELLRANRQLEQFAYLVHRDLSQPLQAVKAGMDGVRDGDDDDRDLLVEQMAQRLDHMERLLDGLLKMSRSGQPMPMGPVDMQAVVDEVLVALTDQIDASGATIQSDPMPVVHGDASQLRHVLAALLDNALTHAGVEQLDIHLGSKVDAGMWHISISDNGVGIDEEHAERVFEPFVTLGQSNGPGIGLSVCDRVIRRHGGEIWVERAATGGTVFTITLPTVKPD